MSRREKDSPQKKGYNDSSRGNCNEEGGKKRLPFDFTENAGWE